MGWYEAQKIFESEEVEYSKVPEVHLKFQVNTRQAKLSCFQLDRHICSDRFDIHHRALEAYREFSPLKLSLVVSQPKVGRSLYFQLHFWSPTPEGNIWLF